MLGFLFLQGLGLLIPIPTKFRFIFYSIKAMQVSLGLLSNNNFNQLL
jgi:hypothetical protein